MTAADAPTLTPFPTHAGAADCPAPRAAYADGRGFPQSWYLVCRSSEVRRGRVVSREVAGHPLVIFRAADGGGVHALSAHCAHMGAHLGRGTVVGDRLRCPLHHWEYDGDGACHGAACAATAAAVDGSNGARAARQMSYPAAERYGNVFVFNGPRPLFPLPSLGGEGDDNPGTEPPSQPLRFGTGRPVMIRCPWDALVANGFDMRHLGAVHGRALREPPVVDTPGPYRIRVRYLSRVTGRGLSDRVMKRLSGDHIRVAITCWGGTLVTVDSDLGRSRSHLLLGVSPTPGGAEATPIFGVRPTALPPLDALRVAVSGWLFSSFLKKDVSIMHDMRFHPPAFPTAEDEPLRRCVEFLRGLPR